MSFVVLGARRDGQRRDVLTSCGLYHFTRKEGLDAKKTLLKIDNGAWEQDKPASYSGRPDTQSP
jgi:hypothetical protein